MSGDDDEQYDNSNRAFLQAFIARSTLTYERSKPILAAIFTAHGTSPLMRIAGVSELDADTVTREARDTF